MGSSDKTVIILAGGEAKRYMGLPKQMVDICGEPLIHRMCRQVIERGYQPTIATDDDTIIRYFVDLKRINDTTVRFWSPAKGTTQYGWATTCPLWKNRVIMLWGDVIFSKHAMDMIFNSKGFCDFGATRQAEGFAFAYNEEDYERVLDAVKQTDYADWAFYRYLIGIPLETEGYDTEIFQDIKDYTTDIDYPLEYKYFLENVVNAGIIDDLPPKPRLHYDKDFLDRIPTEGIVGRALLKSPKHLTI